MKSVIEPYPAEQCYLCGAWGPLEKHHIFGGNPGRKQSEKYGLTVHLCHVCHRDNKKGVHADPELAARIHKIGQVAFEKTHTRQEFYTAFGRFYLDEEDEKEKALAGNADDELRKGDSGMTDKEVSRYLELVERRLYILNHSGIDWKPAYELELDSIDQELAKLRKVVEAEHNRRVSQQHLGAAEEREAAPDARS